MVVENAATLATRQVVFSIASSEEIIKMSVVKVTSAKLTKPKSRLPDEKGVLSLLMGSTDRRIRCGTCENDLLHCPGHFGHIEFASPVYHFGFLKKIVKSLRLLCYWCARPILEKVVDQTEKPISGSNQPTGRPRLQSIDSASSTRGERGDQRLRCTHCIGYLAKYTVSGHGIEVSFPDVALKKTRALPAFKAKSIIERAIWQIKSDKGEPRVNELVESLEKVKNTILEVLVVPPPCIRPSSILENGSKIRGHDDLTRLLSNIVCINTRLEESIKSPENVFGKPDKDMLAELQWTVSSYMHNDIKGERKATNRTGGAMHDVRSRLVGKSGRVRASLMGKRVDYSARSVIRPSVFIGIDEIGVPPFVANTLLKPDIVTQINFEKMNAMLKAGIIKYVHVHPEKSRNSQNSLNSPIEQKSRRILVDLKKPDMIPLLKVGYKVERAMLDGDYVCMNRHPSLHRVSMMGHRARILPAGHLAFQLNPACCPPYNADFDGDEMNLHLPTTYEAEAELAELMSVGHHVISPQNSRMSIGSVQDCTLGLFLLSDPELQLDVDDFFQLVFSGDGLLHEHHPRTGLGAISVFLEPGFSFQGAGVHVISGIIQPGSSQNPARMSKAAIHAILVATAMDYSPTVAMVLLGKWQLLACHYVTMRGFSITLDDCMLGGETEEIVSSYIDSVVCQVNDSIASDDDKNSALGTVLGNLAVISQRNVGEENAIVAMVRSGAKGNSINLAQIRCAVGQQSVNGSRMSGNLPAFRKHNFSCERFGFIRGSYFRGLSPTEFFHHAMSGREGIVDTAVKTAETGYLGRRLSKSFESVKVVHDSSVRSVCGAILQFAYGSDGYDPQFLERVSVNGYFTEKTDDEDDACNYRKYRQLVHSKFNNPNADRFVFLPCDPDRVCLQAADRCNLKDYNAKYQGDCDENQDEINVNLLLECLGGPSCFKTAMLQAVIVLLLRPARFRKKVPLAVHRRWVLHEILTRHSRAIVNSGEMVGIIAAQSIAQPATQLTLNTFHYAGVAAFNVTLGLPRLKELTDASPQSKSPSMVVPVFSGGKIPSDRNVANLLCHCKLENLLRTGSRKLLELPLQLVELPNKLDFLNATQQSLAPGKYEYVELDIEKCVRKLLSPGDILRLILSKTDRKGDGCCSAPEDDVWWLAVSYIQKLPIKQTVISGTDELPNIRDVQVHNTVSIGRCVPFYTNPAVCPQVLLTKGSCLEDLFAAADASVFDLCGVYSNNLHETNEYLGIEAAGTMLFSELRSVLSIDGTFVHDRHFQLISDVMLHSGVIVPLSRHGLNKNMNTGLLARASFEATVDQLLEGALRGEVDYLRGVSENIFLGLFPPMGTGTFDVLNVKANPGIESQLSSVFFRRIIQGGLIQGNPVEFEKLNAIFNLVNILVPYKSTGFSLGPEAGRPLGNSSSELKTNWEDGLCDFAQGGPNATQCLEIVSQMNEFLPQYDGYRPSTPVHAESSFGIGAEIEPMCVSSSEIDIAALYRSIFG